MAAARPIASREIRVRSFFPALVSAVVLLAGCAGSAAPGSTPAKTDTSASAAPTKLLMIYSASSVDQVPAWVALDGGYFQKNGLAVDLHGTGVHVAVVSPGPIDTEIWSLDEELSYTGKLYPPQVVADGVADAIEKGWVHRTVPRQYGLVGALYPLIGRPMRWGLRRYAAQVEKKLRPRPDPS